MIKTILYNNIPPVIDVFLEERYQSYRTTEVFLNDNSVEVFAVQEDGIIKDAFIFKIINGKCKVYNNIVTFEQESVKAFLLFAFSERKVSAIYFSKLLSPLSSDKFPALNYIDVTDCCIDLPHTKEEYNSSLGKKSRKRFNYYFRKIKIIEGVEICINKVFNENDRYLLDDLLLLKERRSDAKNIICSLTPEKLEKIFSISCKYGRISYIKINGKTIGIYLGYQIYSEYYGIAVAFDIDYDSLSIGRVLLYESILKTIEGGIKHHHLLWGDFEYKNHYSGVEKNLYEVIVFNKKSWAYYCKLVELPLNRLIKKIKYSHLGLLLRPAYRASRKKSAL